MFCYIVFYMVLDMVFNIFEYCVLYGC